MTFFAHTLPGTGPEHWEPLEKHLKEVGELAGVFASAFGARDWGHVVGLWHDMGKYSEAFQTYLRVSSDPDSGEVDQVPGRVDHSTFGAQHAAKTLGHPFGQMLAFCIAGHHAGLADGTADDALHAAASLKGRLGKSVPPVRGVPSAPLTRLGLPFKPSPANVGFELAFFVRMLFSCLVDADRLCTERFCSPDQAAARARAKPTLSDISSRLRAHLSEVGARAAPTPVNAIRQSVLSECREAAALGPGLFSLNVPTGGGKTFSSLAFALEHGVAHGMRRVVMAIPFTSIIEQTAEVYRGALGPLAALGLVEHHSSLDPARQTRQHQMATENWDAPVVVTTNVQLYESLFASATTPCRKLHRLARSVIILDEAQTLPVDLLRPTLAALKELVAHYGCSVVLCTATQPALEWRAESFDIGLRDVRPIIKDEAKLFSSLRRTEVRRLGRLSDAELADRITAQRSALCIVNTRAHAATVFDLIAERSDGGDCFHLSTLMCPQHRRETLGVIRERLSTGERCLIVSTQLIEAGVDIDLPVVLRASAGFDSIAQAAGRCNREGKLPGLGQVYLFESDEPPPPGLLRAAAECAAELSRLHPDPLHPDAIRAFFGHLYWHQGHHGWDRPKIMAALGLPDPGRRDLPFKFRQASLDYKIIRDDPNPILVPYNDEARRIIGDLASGRVDFEVLRSSQKFIVGVRCDMLRALEESRVVARDEKSGLWLLQNADAYSPEKGLLPNAAGMDPTVLML
jgi:CRISPR-associated endonuclease/helicase Cas3